MDDSFGYWLSGLVDAAGVFGIHGGACRFRLALTNAQDMLLDISVETDIGGVYPQFTGRWAWEIQSKSDCSALIKILDTYPLRTPMKQEDYMIWRRAVSFWILDEDKKERLEALSYLHDRLLGLIP